uniref:glutathione peroxidase n=1 Tax=Sarcophilus harrisii TaxID=9305 RepID=G3VE40_SARHA
MQETFQYGQEEAKGQLEHELKLLAQGTYTASGGNQPRKNGITGNIYDYGALTIDTDEYIPFKQYAGKYVLFVNVFCLLRGPFSPLSFGSELNALQEDLKSQNLVILGFPCNQFGKQEPGQNSEVLPALKHVRPGGGFVPNFQLFEKGDVNGEKEQKVYTFLKNSCPPPSEVIGQPSRLFWEPMKVHDIRWNFEKFLVGPDGVPIMRWYHRAPVSLVKSDIIDYLQKHGNVKRALPR